MNNKLWKYFSILGFLLVLLLVSELQYTALPNASHISILTPSLAKQETFKMRLKNGLEAYLISDPDATEAGAVLTVRVGNWDDPAQFPGLAHLLEHMLF